MKRSTLLLVAGLALALAGLVAAVANRPAGSPSIPSEADVAAALTWAHDHSGDPDQLCEIAGSQGNCRALLEGAPPPPRRAPEIVCTSPYPGTGARTPGRLVRVTGVDGAGHAYRTDLMALVQDGGTVLMNPVFWRSASVSDSQVSGDALEPCG